MFQRILVPLDGSARAEHAIPLAARLARASRGTLVFVRVVLPPHEIGTYSAGWGQIAVVKPSAFEKRLVEAEHYLTKVTLAYANDLRGINTKLDTETGAAASTIFSVARLKAIDLVVLCSHGKTGLASLFLGSVAKASMRQSPVPVLILNESGGIFFAQGPAQPMRVLVPLDGSLLAETALQPAIQLTAALAAPEVGTLHLLQVVDLPVIAGRTKSQAHITERMHRDARQEAEAYLQTVAERLQEQIPAVSRPVITWSVEVSPDVAGTIITGAEEAADAPHRRGDTIITMATHGRSGLQRLVMGSVTEHLLGATHLPLLIVRPPRVRVEDDATDDAVDRADRIQSWVGLL